MLIWASKTERLAAVASCGGNRHDCGGVPTAVSHARSGKSSMHLYADYITCSSPQLPADLQTCMHVWLVNEHVVIKQQDVDTSWQECSSKCS